MATLTSFRFILLYPRQWISSGRGLRWVHYVLTATSSSEWFCDFSSYICGLLSLVCYMLASSISTPSRETKIGARKWTYQGRLVVSTPGALRCTSVPSGSTYVLDPWQAVQAGRSYRSWHSDVVPSHWVLSSSSNFVPPTTHQVRRGRRREYGPVVGQYWVFRDYTPMLLISAVAIVNWQI